MLSEVRHLHALEVVLFVLGHISRFAGLFRYAAVGSLCLLFWTCRGWQG